MSNMGTTLGKRELELREENNEEKVPLVVGC